VILNVSHRTTFRYSQSVSISHHLLHLRPRATPQQVLVRHSLIVQPPPTVSRNSTDYFGNSTAYITIEESHSELSIVARSTVSVTEPPPVDPLSTMPWDEATRRLAGSGEPDDLTAYQFAFDSPQVAATDAVRDYAAPSFEAGRPILDAALDLMRRIHADFTYAGGVTDVWTPVDTVLEQRKGVCQDFAHLQIACLRAFGVPARYVSGYILTHPPPGQVRLVGADASHAWVSVWVPGRGWFDLDPTNDKQVAEEHVTVAWGRDYADVSPINGLVVGGGRHAIDVAVDVSPGDE
jgi:transglutaminase-like putative cysteine protease